MDELEALFIFLHASLLGMVARVHWDIVICVFDRRYFLLRLQVYVFRMLFAVQGFCYRANSITHQGHAGHPQLRLHL